MKIVPNQISELLDSCLYMEIMTIQGIAEEWRVFAPVESEDRLVFVLHAPTSGPVNWLKKWAETEQEVKVFHMERRDNLDQWRAQDEACHWALRSASDAVLVELVS